MPRSAIQGAPASRAAVSGDVVQDGDVISQFSGGSQETEGVAGGAAACAPEPVLAAAGSVPFAEWVKQGAAFTTPTKARPAATPLRSSRRRPRPEAPRRDERQLLLAAADAARRTGRRTRGGEARGEAGSAAARSEAAAWRATPEALPHGATAAAATVLAMPAAGTVLAMPAKEDREQDERREVDAVHQQPWLAAAPAAWQLFSSQEVPRPQATGARESERRQACDDRQALEAHAAAAQEAAPAQPEKPSQATSGWGVQRPAESETQVVRRDAKEAPSLIHQAGHHLQPPCVAGTEPMASQAMAPSALTSAAAAGHRGPHPQSPQPGAIAPPPWLAHMVQPPQQMQPPPQMQLPPQMQRLLPEGEGWCAEEAMVDARRQEQRIAAREARRASGKTARQPGSGRAEQVWMRQTAPGKQPASLPARWQARLPCRQPVTEAAGLLCWEPGRQAGTLADRHWLVGWLNNIEANLAAAPPRHHACRSGAAPGGTCRRRVQACWQSM